MTKSLITFTSVSVSWLGVTQGLYSARPSFSDFSVAALYTSVYNFHSAPIPCYLCCTSPLSIRSSSPSFTFGCPLTMSTSLLVISVLASTMSPLLYSVRMFQFPILVMFFRCSSGLFRSRGSSRLCHLYVMFSLLKSVVAIATLSSRLDQALLVVCKLVP